MGVVDLFLARARDAFLAVENPVLVEASGPVLRPPAAFDVMAFEPVK